MHFTHNPIIKRFSLLINVSSNVLWIYRLCVCNSFFASSHLYQHADIVVLQSVHNYVSNNFYYSIVTTIKLELLEMTMHCLISLNSFLSFSVMMIPHTHSRKCSCWSPWEVRFTVHTISSVSTFTTPLEETAQSFWYLCSWLLRISGHLVKKFDLAVQACKIFDRR